jgi:iron complex outermembrane receptor protein
MKISASLIRPIPCFVAMALPVSCTQAQEGSTELEPMVITSTALGRTLFEQAQPVSVLEGQALRESGQASLGDTLSKLPGVASSGFAPAASRPVIRGLGEDRIRILNNGVNLLDVSNVSPDHAVTVDPLLMDKVEVLRGPASLLYGPNGVGGVVNVLDGRIPESKVKPGLGGWPVRGMLDSRYASGSDLWAGAGMLDLGLEPVVLHVDGFRRETEDVRIPGQARSARLQKLEPLEEGREPAGHLLNSFSESEGGSVGASWLWNAGCFGVSRSFLTSNYGTVGEEPVTIGLDQESWNGRGAFYGPVAGVKQIKYSFGYSEYSHTEFEGREAGTVFKIKGYDGRVELEHEPLGPFEGLTGYQTSHSDFSALGEEAFLPPVETASHAVFLFEEVKSGNIRWEGSLRYDHTKVESGANGGFGPGKDLSFDGLSGSAGLVWSLPEDYQVALHAAFTQRPPTYVELLAEGPHLATGAYERGDAELGMERSMGLDLSLRKKSGFLTGSVNAFYSRFNGYIGLFPTGDSFAFEGEGEISDLPVYAYRAVDADLMGGEVEATFHLLAPAEAPAESTGKSPAGKSPLVRGTGAAPPAPRSGSRLDLEWKADYVYSRLRGEGGALPRIPPFRTSAALIFGYERFTARLEGQYSAAQRRTAEGELPTDAFFLLNAGLSYQLMQGPVTVEVFVRGTNLLDEEARLHTSFLKDIAPMEGRGIAVGMQASF